MSAFAHTAWHFASKLPLDPKLLTLTCLLPVIALSIALYFLILHLAGIRYSELRSGKVEELGLGARE